MPDTRHIAVVGGSGSGKTWLARELCAALGPGAAQLSLDNFYRDLSRMDAEGRGQVNFDDPAAIDWDAARSVIDTLAHGKTAAVPDYDFATHTRHPKPSILAPPAFLVWDGLWLLHDPALRERFLFSVFVSCDEAERLARRVERDVRERGRTPDSVKRQFLAHVRPMHDLFVEPQRDLADAILQSPAPPDRLAALKHDLLQRAGLPETRRNAAA